MWACEIINTSIAKYPTAYAHTFAFVFAFCVYTLLFFVHATFTVFMWVSFVSAFMYSSIYVFMYLCMYVFVYPCNSVCTHSCIRVFMYWCIDVFMYLCICAFMDLCIYVFMYSCIHVFIYSCICASTVLTSMQALQACFEDAHGGSLPHSSTCTLCENVVPPVTLLVKTSSLRRPFKLAQPGSKYAAAGVAHCANCFTYVRIK